MKVTWLGQAGLWMETEGVRILVDPYLSDSVEAIQPHNRRRIPVDERFFGLKPHVIVLTHDHLDHTDPETLAHFLKENTAVCVLASGNAWERVRKIFGGISNNYVCFNSGTEWTERGLLFRAVCAEHSDPCAIGFVLEAEGKRFYITGDTLYHPRVLAEAGEGIDYVFLPVNGVGNNMNMADGVRFCEALAATALPYHCGLFDEKKLEDFPYGRKIVMKCYGEVELK